MSKYEESAERVQTPAPPTAYEPYRAPSAHSDVLVPVEQAAVGGALLASTLCVLVLGVITVFGLSRPALDVWLVLWLVPFVVFTSLLWFRRLRWASGTIYKVEQLTGVDLNKDGDVGEPNVHWMSQGQKHEADRNGVNAAEKERRRLEEFLNACYSGSTDSRTLRNKGFTEREMVRFRALLMRPDVGIARWTDDTRQHGWKLVKTQDEAMEIIRRLVPLPGKTK